MTELLNDVVAGLGLRPGDAPTENGGCFPCVAATRGQMMRADNVRYMHQDGVSFKTVKNGV
jgi:hypothetical protein